MKADCTLISIKKKDSSSDLREAIRLAERAVSLDPYDAMLHQHLGNLYWKSGELVKAEQHLKLGVRYGAYVLSLYLDMAKFYTEVGKSEQAEEVLIAAVNLIEYAVKKASYTDKPTRLIEAAFIHQHLAKIYEQREERSLNEHHLSEGQSFLKEAFTLQENEINN